MHSDTDETTDCCAERHNAATRPKQRPPQRPPSPLNPTPCRKVLTPRERKCPSSGGAADEARFQVRGETFGEQAHRSSVDLSYIEPRESEDQWSRSLRFQTACERPRTPSKCGSILTAQTPSSIGAADCMSPPEGALEFARLLRTTPSPKKLRPLVNAGTPNFSPNFFSPLERRSCASLNADTPECEGGVAASKPRAPPRIQRPALAGFARPSTPDPSCKVVSRPTLRELQRPLSAESRRRPATPDRKPTPQQLTAGEGRNRPATPNSVSKPISPPNQAQEQTTTSEDGQDLLKSDVSSCLEPAIAPSASVPVQCGLSRRELEAIQKHLERRSATSRSTLHSTFGGATLPVSRFVSDAREHAVHAERNERAVAAAPHVPLPQQQQQCSEDVCKVVQEKKSSCSDGTTQTDIVDDTSTQLMLEEVFKPLRNSCLWFA